MSRKIGFMTGLLVMCTLPVYADTYVVQPNDTLYSISGRFQTTVAQLKQDNKLVTDALQIGQVLNVSGSVPNLLATPIPAAVPIVKESSPNLELTVPNRALVSVPVLNVRETPTIHSVILQKINWKDEVEVISWGEEWTKVLFGTEKKLGYVATAFIEKAPAPKPVVPSRSNSPSHLVTSLKEIVDPLLGIPYLYGGDSIEGFDCSGFTKYVFQQFGLTLPRTSGEQFQMGESIEREYLQPGDLLFYDTLKKNDVSHVGIYLGNGKLVHADGVKVTMIQMEYMDKLYPYYGAKRLL